MKLSCRKEMKQEGVMPDTGWTENFQNFPLTIKVTGIILYA